MDHGAPVSWDDIAGLQFAKATIKEIVVWPMLRPYVVAMDSSVDSSPEYDTCSYRLRLV